MERIVEQGLLYDFYGELLTDHQRKIYEDIVFNDLSPSEIAREEGISRQGVHDLVRRCNRILEGYEDKLHLVARFMKIRSTVEEIQRQADAYMEEPRTDCVRRIRELSEEITSAL